MSLTVLSTIPPRLDAGGDTGLGPGPMPSRSGSTPAANGEDVQPERARDRMEGGPARPADYAPAYADRLVEEARRRSLHQARYWHTLLHYKQTLTGFKSLVDDPRFFLSPRGKHDAQAELEATIRAFFAPDTPATKHPVCRFVARYHWIKEQLNLDPSRLPVKECEHFTRLIQEMRPESTTLVFPTSHMNSPASMFGHTLLTYEAASGNKLLAYAVNYSAITTETFGPLFAAKGIFGLYTGYFSVLPYYAKLQEYSDIEHRDMWEYPLNFTREETIRSIMHVYELDGIYSDYYFFDENCSYSLLFLLDAGRPSLALTDQVPPWVIPLDTIRVVQEAGLITGTVYRPAMTTRIQRMASRLGRPSRLLALQLAQGEAEPEGKLTPELPQEEKARAYDLAVEYLQYLYAGGRVARDVYADRFVRLLTARSALGTPVAEQHETGPPPRPEEGHRSNRLQIGFGLRKGDPFQELRFRFAYHTLNDYARGYPEGFQIVFADTAVRYDAREHQVTLHQMDVVDILSIAPRDDLFRPISWKIRAGLARRTMEGGRDHLIAQLSPGAGLAYRIHPLGLFYAMLETDGNAGGALRESYALGIGGSIGIISSVTDRWKVSLSARGMYYGLGDRHGLLDVTATQNYALTPNLAISLEMSWGRTREFHRTEGKLGLNIFF